MELCRFLALLVGILAVSVCVSALYEDQAGKWDWRQRYIGKIKHISSYHLSSAQSIVVTSEKNVLASIFIRNGTINWRQILESRDAKPAADVVNAMSSGDDYYGLSEVVSAQSLLTVSGNGRYVRSWDAITGLLEAENSLPEDVVGDIEIG